MSQAERCPEAQRMRNKPPEIQAAATEQPSLPRRPSDAEDIQEERERAQSPSQPLGWK